MTDDVVTVPVGGTATVGLTQMEIIDVITTVTEEKAFYHVLLSRALTGSLLQTRRADHY